MDTGYWYRLKTREYSPFRSEYMDVKIIPSERWLECQDPKEDYFEVLTKTTDNRVVSCYTGSTTMDEVKDYINRYFETTEDDRPKLDKLLEELKYDKSLIEVGVQKKYKEIAIHLQDAIDLLEGMKNE